MIGLYWMVDCILKRFIGTLKFDWILDVLRVKGSMTTDLTTDPLNVFVSLGLFLMPITLLGCPKT